MELMKLFPYEKQEATIFPQSIPWNIQIINTPSFWANKTKGNGAVAAVVDTGIDVNHCEFAGRIIDFKNFTKTDNKDTDGHGTHVAGIIGGNNIGVTPEARVMALKVFGDVNVNANIHEAFLHILKYNETAKEEDKVIVVNCSFGGSYDGYMHYLIRRLINSGVAVIVAAGNSGDGKADTIEFASYPSFLYEVITTGAVDKNGQPAGYSNTHDGIDIGAPGSEIYSAWSGGGYKLLSGTSMATPHITGLYLLIAAAFRMREGRYPTVAEGESILFKHIRKVNIDPAFVGRGIADATYDTKRWPLYHVQVGAYFNRSGAEEIKVQVRTKGFDKAFIVTY